MDERAKVTGFIEQMLPGQQVTASTKLVTTGKIDSLGVVGIVAFLEENFGIDLSERGFDPKDFDSIDTIVDLIKALKNS